MTGNVHDSFSSLIDQINSGDERAQRRVWDTFFPHLLGLARKRMLDAGRRVRDEEDVALSVLNSYFSAAQENKFPNVRGHDELWRLLSRMTQRKVVDWIRYQSRQKRMSLGESAIFGNTGNPPDFEGNRPAEQIVGKQLPPDIESMFAEQCSQWMARLDKDLQEVVLKKLNGHSNAEIAESCQCSLATIERRLKLVREIWMQAENEQRTESNDASDHDH